MTESQNVQRLHGRRSARLGLMAAMLVFAGIGGAMAQTPGECDGANNLPANTHLEVTQQQGRALIDLDRAGSAGQTIQIEYGDELYSTKFGPAGKLTFAFALTAATNEFTIDMTESPPIACKLAVPGFQKLYRVILRWRDPVQLDLYVLEPGGRAGETGDVNSKRPNTDLSDGIGKMDIIDGPPDNGATAEMSYVVANPASIPPNSTFGFKLDYVTRGSRAVAPYCDDQPLAAPNFDFIVIANGKVTTQRMSTNRARCGEKIPDALRLMPIRQ